MNKHVSLAASFLLSSLVPSDAQSVTAGWPDTIDLLTEERSQAEACAALLKSSGERPAIAQGRIAYSGAKAASDGVGEALSRRPARWFAHPKVPQGA